VSFLWVLFHCISSLSREACRGHGARGLMVLLPCFLRAEGKEDLSQ